MEIVFLETTVISYLVARPSRDRLLAEHQALTRRWWDAQRGNYQCVTSEEVVREVLEGEQEMARRRFEALAGVPVLRVTDEVWRIADSFLGTGALPPSMRSDALHLAVAVTAGADYLLTWNCRHLANGQVLRRIEREAVRLGRVLPTVLTPLELSGENHDAHE